MWRRNAAGNIMKLLILVSIVLFCESAHLTKNQCSQSRDCGRGLCCRDANNRLVDSVSEGPLLTVGGINTGTCTECKAGRGEICSGGCPCGPGLECYRPVTGVCCPPSTCQPTEFVERQREIWRKCFADPNCALPQ